MFWDAPCTSTALQGERKGCRALPVSVGCLEKSTPVAARSSVLSRALMSWFDFSTAPVTFCDDCRMSYNDDMGLGAFMTVVANAPVTVMLLAVGIVRLKARTSQMHRALTVHSLLLPCPRTVHTP